MRRRLEAWRQHWFWKQDDVPEELAWLPATGVLLLCRLLGHFVVDDHCKKPEHRFCCYCLKDLPHRELSNDRSNA